MLCGMMDTRDTHKREFLNYKNIMLKYIMTKYTDFVKAHMTKRNMSWSCAVCDIKSKKLYKPKMASPTIRAPVKTSSDSSEFIREFDREFNKDFLGWLNKLTPKELSEMARDAPRGKGMRYATRKSKKSHRRNSRGRLLKSKK